MFAIAVSCSLLYQLLLSCTLTIIIFSEFVASRLSTWLDLHSKKMWGQPAHENPPDGCSYNEIPMHVNLSMKNPWHFHIDSDNVD